MLCVSRSSSVSERCMRGEVTVAVGLQPAASRRGLDGDEGGWDDSDTPALVLVGRSSWRPGSCLAACGPTVLSAVGRFDGQAATLASWCVRAHFAARCDGASRGSEGDRARR